MNIEDLFPETLDLILSYLDPPSIHSIRWTSHAFHEMTSPVEFETLIKTTVALGYVNILECIYSYNNGIAYLKSRWTPGSNASQLGHLEMVKWLDQKGYIWRDNAFMCAIENGHLEIVQYLYRDSIILTGYMANEAARKGHLEILKWLRDKGCPWGMRVCQYSRDNGHLDVLKWAIDNGCPDYMVLPD